MYAVESFYNCARVYTKLINKETGEFDTYTIKDENLCNKLRKLEESGEIESECLPYWCDKCDGNAGKYIKEE